MCEIYAIDFEYDGSNLSDFWFIVCTFNSDGGASTIDAGSAINMETVQMSRGAHFELTSAKYDKALETTFQICKNPDMFSPDEREITRSEFRKISMWLNRRKFLPFRIKDPDDLQSDICYFNASFNLSKIQIAGKTYGIELKMMTDSPHGHGEEVTAHMSFESQNDRAEFSCYGDEYGFIYPNMSITCAGDGDIHFSCDLGRCDFKVKGCSNGEVITVDGTRRIITSSSSTHDIANDFNYEFFRAGITKERRDNVVISKGIPCSVLISYEPTIKDVPY